MAGREGQLLGDYRLIAQLGQGSYAQVYLGQHIRLPLQAAVKVLHTHLTDSEAERFQHEAETIARLAHPSIVRVLDYNVQEGVPFLVMDYAPGGSLRRRYPKGSQIPLPQLIVAVKQVAAALHYAHENKVIHRDVKPENMLLGRQQEVLLSDFGLATLAQSTSSLNRSAQGTAGTIAYMAPEQIEGHPCAASDQYALGVVVYEWLCGVRPFEGSVSEVMVQQLTMPPPALRECVPTIPAVVEQVVLQALAKDPKLRFASVQDFALTLEAACSREVSLGQTFLALSSASLARDRHASKHNLPVPLTPLIGREQEVTAACTLLRRPEVRLVSLTGPGGVGKTRLALQVATEVLVDFPDGISFVSLAPISDPALVMPIIAQVLDIKESGARPLLDLLTAFLQDKHLMLCLDNFEQLLSAAPHLTDLLSKCPHLTILVTSRAALHVQGEHEFPVPPLAVPDLTQLPPIDTLPHYAAVALFLQRAQAVKPTFQMNSTNARPIAEICVRLDGLPLAIELAAARVKLFFPQALLARLGQRLAVLTSGARDAPARQQTLRHTIAWSYHLLNASERRLFRRISVFVGSCMLEAVEAVCAALDGEAAGVVDDVSSLIDKSLLQHTEQESQEPLLVMLETIREYALEALATSGEMEDTRRAHAAYYLRLVEEAEPELIGPLQTVWLERLEREHENLRAALNWSLEQARDEEAKTDHEIALRLAGALKYMWHIHGHYREGRTFLERVLVESQEAVGSARVKVLTGASVMAGKQGDLDRAEALIEESLALCRALGDAPGLAHSLQSLGWLAALRGNLAKARSLLEEGLTLCKEVGDKSGLASALAYMARLAGIQGEYTRARTLFEEALALYRELEDKFNLALTSDWFAQVLFVSQGDPVLVGSLLEESLGLVQELGERAGTMAFALRIEGQVALSQGDTPKARERAEKSLELLRETGERGAYVAEVFCLLAGVEAHQGNHAAARSHYEESLAEAREMGNRLVIAPSLEGLAGVVAAQGEFTWAVRLWGAAEALRETIGAPLPPVECPSYEQVVTAARIHIGEKAFAAAWAEGRTMIPEQALTARGSETIPTPVPIEQPLTRSAKPSPAYPDGLTAREVEVLRLVAHGLTNEQVAKQLIISPRTVNTHLTTIFSKIGVSSRSAATRYAIEHHVV